MTIVTARTAWGSLALVSALLVSGCTAQGPESPVSVLAPVAQGITPPHGVVLTGEECLVGGWRLTGEPLHDYVVSFEPGNEIEVTGELDLGFTLEHYSVESQVGIVWLNRGHATLASLVGDTEGSYRLVDGVFRAITEWDELTLVEVERGERSEVPELFLHPIAVNPLANATVKCTGDSLTVFTARGESQVRVAFTRLR